jgi:hypothetical protein
MQPGQLYEVEKNDAKPRNKSHQPIMATKVEVMVKEYDQ